MSSTGATWTNCWVPPNPKTHLTPLPIMSVLLRTAALTSLITLSAQAQDWPIFRGPTGDGHVAAQQLPTEWSATKNIAWHVTLPGRGWSSPILVAGKLYLTAAVAEGGNEADPKADRSLRALCVDAADGRTLWNVPVFAQEGAKAPGIHSKNSHASPTPVFHEGRLYLHFGHQGTACLDLSGQKIWENRQFFYTPVHGGGSTPIVVGNNLIFSCDGSEEQFVAALRLKDGSVAWKFQRPTDAKRKFAFATPECITVNGRQQLITPGADVVNALDPTTGEEIWRCHYEGYSVVPKPVYGNGLVYICTSFDTPDVLAIKPDGKGDVTETHIAWQVAQNKRPPCTASMVLDGTNLFWVSDGGLASCVDALTGESIWCERVGKGYSASPILADGHLYFLDETGTCTVLEASRTFKILSQNTLPGQRTLASLAATQGTLFLRSEEGLYCIRN